MRKLLTIIIILCLFLVGCQGGKPTKVDNTDDPEITHIADNVDRYTELKNIEKVLTWVIPDLIVIKDSIKDEFNLMLLSKGYDFVVNFSYLDYSSYNNKLMEARMSGLPMDIVFTGLGSIESKSVNPIYIDIKEGTYISLNDYLNTDTGKALYDLFDKKIWKSVEVSKNIYTIPHGMPIGNGTSFLFNKTHIDEREVAGFSGKLSELEPILNKSSKQKDFSPLVLSSLSRVSDSFNYIDSEFVCDSVLISYSDKKAYSITESLDFRDYIITLNKYYMNRYLNYNYSFLGKNDPSQEQAVRLIKSGNFIVSGFTNIETPAEAFTISTKPHIMSRLRGSTGIAVTSEYKDEAFELLALVHTNKELANILMHGILNKDYQLIDGYAYDMDGNPHTTTSKELCLGIYENVYPNILDDPKVDRLASKEEHYINNVLASPILGFNFDDRDYYEVIKKVDSIVNENIEQLWKSDNIELELDRLDGLLKEAGIDELENAVNKQLKSWFEE